MKTRTALWATAAAIAAIAIFVTAWLIASNRNGEGQQTNHSQTQSPRPTTPGGDPSPASGGSSAPSAANGCLGGEDPQTAVLAAQDAPANSEGAAAFAASLARFVGFAPRSNTSSDMATVRKIYSAPLAAQIVRAGYVVKLPSSEIIRAWSDTKEANYRVVSVAEGRVVLDYWVTGHFQGTAGDQADRILGYRSEFRNINGKWIFSKGLATAPDYDSVVKSNFQGTIRYAGGC